MVSVLRNPTQAPRVVPFGVARTSTDKLPNGHPAFRVTQRYADTDRYFGGIHGAIDLGNYYCGDRMLAAHSGRIANKRDIYGALIVEITASDGSKTGYGHLDAYWQNHGAWVAARAVIGIVGDTGLGNICHCHFYHRGTDGRLRDPWPMLEQNQATSSSGIVATGYVRFNAGVNGVNIRVPDSQGRVHGSSPIYAVAYSDADPKPNGIVRRSDGKWLGNTSARRTLYGTHRGSDGIVRNRLRIAGTGRYEYVEARFMHRVSIA
jgi:hypothetical protein